MRAEEIQAAVDDIVARFRMPDDVHERVLALVRDGEREADVATRRARAQERLRRLYAAGRRRPHASIEPLVRLAQRSTRSARRVFMRLGCRAGSRVKCSRPECRFCAFHRPSASRRPTMTL